MAFTMKRANAGTILGWSASQIESIYKLLTGYGLRELSRPVLTGQMISLKQNLGIGAQQDRGLPTFHNAITLMASPFGIKGVPFECTVFDGAGSEAWSDASVGRLAITWSGVGPDDLKPSLEAQIGIKPNANGFHQMLQLQATHNAKMFVELTIERFECDGLDAFSKILKQKRSIELNILRANFNFDTN